MSGGGHQEENAAAGGHAEAPAHEAPNAEAGNANAGHGHAETGRGVVGNIMDGIKRAVWDLGIVGVGVGSAMYVKNLVGGTIKEGANSVLSEFGGSLKGEGPLKAVGNATEKVLSGVVNTAAIIPEGGIKLTKGVLKAPGKMFKGLLYTTQNFIGGIWGKIKAVFTGDEES